MDNEYTIKKLDKIASQINNTSSRELVRELNGFAEKAYSDFVATGQKFKEYSFDDFEEIDMERYSKWKARGVKKRFTQELLYCSYRYFFVRKMSSLNDFEERLKKSFAENGIAAEGDNVLQIVDNLLKGVFDRVDASMGAGPVKTYSAIDGRVEEGIIFTLEDIGRSDEFTQRKRDRSGELFFRHYYSFNIRDEEIFVPYIEIYGLEQGNVFVEGENLEAEIDSFGWDPDMKNYIVNELCDGDAAFFEEEMEKARAAAAEKGYVSHPPKLCLKSFLRTEYMNKKFSLKLVFGQSGYLEHIVYRRKLLESRKAQDRFESVIRDTASFSKEPWANCGGGVWMVTSDGFLAVSFRRSNVGEVNNMLSYSSSGAFDRYRYDANGEKHDNSPKYAIAAEIMEETGIEADMSKLQLISLGIDADRQLIQFSYFMRLECNAGEFKKMRRRACDRHEQIVFFIPFTKECVQNLLGKCEMEPGAAYSLYELMENECV